MRRDNDIHPASRRPTRTRRHKPARATALAPLLAGEGIDVDNIDVPDLEALQRAMDRAVERQNMALFTPVGRARDLAAATMRLAVEAIADGDTILAGSILERVQPESPDNGTATVAGCIGLAFGLLDEWLSGRDPQAPAGSGSRPGVGSVNVPPPTSSSWPTRATHSGR